jgi:DNA modification methylase
VPHRYIPSLIGADARRIPLADGSVQCVVTSPPYWSLRAYAGEKPSIWGGLQDCKHEWGTEKKIKQSAQRDHAKGGGFANTRGTEASRRGMAFESSQGCLCANCGAWKGSFGLEPTPKMYVDHTIEIMREVRRVLNDDGVVFWNLDDTYLKNKSLAAIPDRVKIATLDDGWIVRDDLIWEKPNPMPESVKDRCTGSYERMFMLTKKPKYYWDCVASREPATSKDAGADGKRNPRNVWTIPLEPFRGEHFAAYPTELPRRCISMASRKGDLILDPFGGSGTTGQVATELGRPSVLLDVNFTGEGGYERVARQRFAKFLCSEPPEPGGRSE